MRPLYIGSTSSFSGKTLVSIGLGKRFIDSNSSIGYMKPYGKMPVSSDMGMADQDAVFMRDILGLDEPLDLLCPVLMTHDMFARRLSNHPSLEHLPQVVKNAYESLSAGKDFFILGGAGDLYDGLSLGIPPVKIVNMLDARVLLVHPYHGGGGLDYLLVGKELFGERLSGVIINLVEPQHLEYVMEQIVPYLKSQGIPIAGVLPKDNVLGAISVRQINDILNGEVLSAGVALDNLVETLSIGAMNVDDAIKYFARKSKKAVITGGDRPDIQLAALETSTSCLVLTGNIPPGEVILAKSEEKGVPILLSKEDTFTTVELLEKAMGKLRIRETEKVVRAVEMVKSCVNMELIDAAFG